MDVRSALDGPSVAVFQPLEYEHVRLVCPDGLSTLDMRAPRWRRLLHPDERAERCVGIVHVIEGQTLAAAEIIWGQPKWTWRELGRGDVAELAAAANARSDELWRAGWRYVKPYRGSPFYMSRLLIEGVARYVSEGGFANDE